MKIRLKNMQNNKKTRGIPPSFLFNLLLLLAIW